MIQRKQTIFLILAFVLLLLSAVFDTSVPYASLIAGVAALGSLITVFVFNRRPLQASLCLVLICLGLAYYLAIAVFQHSINGTLVFTWPMALPLLAIVFLFMARKGIQKDEKLVKSLDRIR